MRQCERRFSLRRADRGEDRESDDDAPVQRTEVGELLADQSDDQHRGEDHDEADRHRFKVPTLRNVALTAPYFHNGLQKTLPETVKTMAWLQLGLDLKPEQVDSLVAFLGSLTDKSRGGNKKSASVGGVPAGSP